MNAKTFEAFQAQGLCLRIRCSSRSPLAPDTALDTHIHPFDAGAVVIQGEMWLTCEGRTRRLTPGDTFTLLRGVPHAAALRPARGRLLGRAPHPR
ncbi:conserved hypothetical protein [Thiomonas sp. X19]|uniref:cupin domain-containing protein n=1 Tax=Thiomonas sp. X19 TaxID=1050370 RepID=UPI000B64E6C6|nr:cupin domain-containing protein [Thiomonas sp. X19]SCC95117.1 conserved hypothetical protein [Thiomonas sp. X19]